MPSQGRPAYPAGVRDHRAPALVGCAAGGLAAVHVTLTGLGVPEFIFEAVLLSCLGALLLALGGQVGQWRGRRRGLRLLMATDPNELARVRLQVERRRLDDDLNPGLITALSLIATEASAGRSAADPAAHARRIRELSRGIGIDLKAQLVRLREDEAPPAQAPASPPATGGRPGLDRLAVAVFALAALESLAYPPGPVPTPTLVWTLAVAATVFARRSAPLAATSTAVTLLCGSALLVVPVTAGFWQLGLVGALVVACTEGARSPRLGWVAAGGLLGAWVAAVRVTAPDNAALTVALAAVLAVGVLLRQLVGSARRRTERAVAAQEQTLAQISRRAVATRRLALARDLHDAVSHAVGLIAVHAGAVEVGCRADPDRARSSLTLIGITCDRAIQQIRCTGSWLADPVASTAEIVDRFRLAGVEITVDQRTEVPGVYAEVVDRIILECLTNAVRHAPGARVRLRLVADDTALVVQIVDSGGPTCDDVPAPHRGFGLAGLRERVELVGGQVQHGRSGKGFAVCASLPMPAGRQP